MAKLEIIQSTENVATSTTPRTSTLALPMSLASTVGSGYQSVANSIAAIQKDLYAIEDDNQVNEVMPEINKKVAEIYAKYKNSTNITDDPKNFENDISVNNFETILQGKNNTVKRLLTNKIKEKKAELVPKLVGQISTNTSEKFLVGLGTQFDTAISLMVSTDQATMARGTVMFENLAKNEAYASTVGYKEYKDLVKTKTTLKNKLLLNANLQINPEVILESREALVKEVGEEAANSYIEEATQAVINKRALKDSKERFELLRDQETQLGAFTEISIRIQNGLNNPTDENLQNEMPTVNELYSLFEDGLINEPMFVRLSTFLADPENDGLTNEEIHNAVTVQLYSAKTIKQLDDIKKSYILDNEILVNMAMEDISAFTALIDKGKKDFKSHRDYQHYSKMIDKNIAMMTFTGYEKMQEKAETATRKQEIQNSYTNKVLNGMKPENAYYEIVMEELDEKAVPKLNLLSFPVKNVDWSKALADTSYFDNVSNQLLEKYKNSNKSVSAAKQLMDDLDKVNFVQTIFEIRKAIAPIDPKSDESKDTQIFNFATQSSDAAGVINFNPGS